MEATAPVPAKRKRASYDDGYRPTPDKRVRRGEAELPAFPPAFPTASDAAAAAAAMHLAYPDALPVEHAVDSHLAAEAAVAAIAEGDERAATEQAALVGKDSSAEDNGAKLVGVLTRLQRTRRSRGAGKPRGEEEEVKQSEADAAGRADKPGGAGEEDASADGERDGDLFADGDAKRRPSRKNGWHEEEEQLLIRYRREGMTIKQITAALAAAGFPHRSVSAVSGRAVQLRKAGQLTAVVWEAEEDEMMIELRKQCQSYVAITAALRELTRKHRTVGAVQNHAYVLRVKKKLDVSTSGAATPAWLEEEDALLTDMAARSAGLDAMAAALLAECNTVRTAVAIRTRLWVLRNRTRQLSTEQLRAGSSGSGRGRPRPVAWTAEEDAMLLELRKAGYEAQVIARRLVEGGFSQRTARACAVRALRLMKSDRPARVAWSQHEDTLLLALRDQHLTFMEVAVALKEIVGQQRTKAAVHRRAAILRAKRAAADAPSFAAWTAEEDDVLRALTRAASPPVHVAALHDKCASVRSIAEVQARLYALETGRAVSADRAWTAEQDALLVRLYSEGAGRRKISAALRSRGFACSLSQLDRRLRELKEYGPLVELLMWSSDEMTKLVALQHVGMTADEIAKQLRDEFGTLRTAEDVQHHLDHLHDLREVGKG
eukprot:PLAT11847.1.p1 GENE.PLAT11847.1~~PLAT11847.1.p1  ORF type:complete len:660 (-),score=234.38 PLAT11847.1:200-2179(-)